MPPSTLPLTSPVAPALAGARPQDAIAPLDFRRQRTGAATIALLLLLAFVVADSTPVELACSALPMLHVGAPGVPDGR